MTVAPTIAADGQPAFDPATQLLVDWLDAQPATQAFLPLQARAILSRLQSTPVGKPRASITEMVFPVGPTGSVEVRMVRPPDTSHPLPVLMLFRGGGSVLGDQQTHDRLMREIAVGAKVAVLFVGYGSAPDSRFPVAIEQAYAATRHVAGEALRLNLDPNRLAVLGDGIGGMVAAAVTLMAKERRGPNIELQILLYPVTDAGLDTPSYRQFADGPWLTRSAMRWFWDAYLPDASQRRDSKATPLNATLDQLRDLPEALVILAENDVLRDEGEAYARKLADAGVRVTSVRYSGTIHDFLLFDALADTPAVRSALAQVIGALKSAFD